MIVAAASVPIKLCRPVMYIKDLPGIGRCEAAHLAEDFRELVQQVRPVLAPGLGVDQHQEGDAELRHDAACHASRVTTPRVTCHVYHRPECLTTITAPASGVLEAASQLSALSLR